MNIYSNRLRSFRVNSKWPRSSKERPPIEDFASAGFYYPQKPKTVDSVRCFLCKIDLDQWDQNSSPRERHSLSSPLCPWVLLGFPQSTKSLKVNPRDSNSWPRSETMRRARQKTFSKDNNWPPQSTRTSDLNRRQFPTPSKLAAAGFCYIPSSEKDTKVVCVYCHCTVADKDMSTDLVARHRQLKPSCPFFQTHPVDINDDSDDNGSRDSWVSAVSELDKNTGKDITKRVTRQTIQKPATNSPQKSLDKKRASPSTEDVAGQTGKKRRIDPESTNSPRENFIEDSVWNISKAFENKDGLGRRQLPVPKSVLLTYSKRQRKKLAPILPDNLTQPVEEALKTNEPLKTCIEPGANASNTPPWLGLPREQSGGKAPLKAVARKTLSLSKRKIVGGSAQALDYSRQTVEKETDEENGQRSREITPPVYAGHQRNFTTSTPIHGTILPDLEGDDSWLASPIRPQKSSGVSRSPGLALFPFTPHIERSRAADESRLVSQPNIGHHQTLEGSLSQEQLKMTVEDYLRSLMEDKVAAVKRRGEEQINEIERQVKQMLSGLELANKEVK
ncbi:hypothetical protein CLU79DRAFT_726817 [Phycomyces nitens]|nr:hypothetical protein CLU79DRAFT_726817 [Phycomyces nitens]